MIRIEAGRFYAETMERGGVEAYPSPPSLGKNMHLWKWNNVNDMHVSRERERDLAPNNPPLLTREENRERYINSMT